MGVVRTMVTLRFGSAMITLKSINQKLLVCLCFVVMFVLPIILSGGGGVVGKSW